MSNLYILKSQQPAWLHRPLIEDEPGGGNNGTLVLNNSSGASVSLTGLEIIGQSEGATHDVLNRGVDPIVLLKNNPESSIPNRFADDATLPGDACARLYYNGSNWEVLSVGAAVDSSGGSIGSDLTGSTPGSILFVTSGGKLAEDNAAFNWDDVTKRLSLVDKTYGGWGTGDMSIASASPRTLVGSYASLLLDNSIFGNGDGEYFFGFYNSLAVGGPGIIHANIVGNLLYVGNRAAPATYIGGTDLMECVDITTNIEVTTLEGYGIMLFASTGSGDAAGTGKISGIWSTAGTHIGSCSLVNAGEFRIRGNDGGAMTVANILKGVVQTLGDPTPINDLRGLAFEAWTVNATVGKSAVIFCDPTVDIGTLRYFIESHSTSPSLFSGEVRVPAKPYDAATWLDDPSVPTRGELRNKIETLGGGGGGSDWRKKVTVFLDFTDIYITSPLPTPWAAFTVGVTLDGYILPIDPDGVGLTLAQADTTPGAKWILNAGRMIFFGIASWVFETRFRLESLSSGTNTFHVDFGFNDAINSPVQLSAVYFSYTHSSNGGKWLAHAANNVTSQSTTADTGVLAETSDFHTFRIEVNAAGDEAKYFIDGVLVATISGSQYFQNDGTAQYEFMDCGFNWIRTAGATALDMFTMDYIAVESDVSGVR